MVPMEQGEGGQGREVGLIPNKGQEGLCRDPDRYTGGDAGHHKAPCMVGAKSSAEPVPEEATSIL